MSRPVQTVDFICSTQPYQPNVLPYNRAPLSLPSESNRWFGVHFAFERHTTACYFLPRSTAIGVHLLSGGNKRLSSLHLSTLASQTTREIALFEQQGIIVTYLSTRSVAHLTRDDPKVTSRIRSTSSKSIRTPSDADAFVLM